MSGRAILLVNLGSPASTKVSDVRRYLDQFLMDPRVIDLPFPLRAAVVRGLVLPTRPRRSAEAYASIWWPEGSPLIAISQRLRGALEAQSALPVGLAMRYAEPSIASGVAALRARCGSLDELIVVPLYPHYAMASYETVEVAVREQLAGQDWYGRLRFVPPFFDDPAYLAALAASIEPHLAADDYLLFSYHGLPKRHLRKTDPTGNHCLRSSDCCERPSPAHATCYRHQVFETTRRVAARLGLAPERYGVAFQSRLGSGWLEPFTDVELARLPKRGITRLAVVCPAFVSDCLETLEEMSLRGRKTFLAAGGTSFTYVPCLNDDPAWVAALAGLCAAAAARVPA